MPFFVKNRSPYWPFQTGCVPFSVKHLMLGFKSTTKYADMIMLENNILFASWLFYDFGVYGWFATGNICLIDWRICLNHFCET